MNTSSNGYVLGFAVTVCVLISAMLAATDGALKETKAAAKEFDRQKNVMIAAGLMKRDDARPRAEIEALYKERVREQVVDTASGKVVDGKSSADLVALNKQAVAEEKDPAKAKDAGKRFRVVFVGKLEDGASAYILPIEGKGLWSTIKGYLALQGDAATVRGVTFYEHGETPGLGGECENPVWCEQWVGKTILTADKKLFGIEVKKGKVDPSIAVEKAHKVDGLSGATITCNGITKFVKSDLKALDGYLAPLRK